MNRSPDAKGGGKSRVLFLTESFYPPFVGGLEKNAYLVSRKLVENGIDLAVLTRKQEPASPETEVFGNVPINRIAPVGILKGKGWNALGPMMLLVIRVTYFLLRHAGRYDVVLVSGVRILSIPAVLVSKVLRKRCVIRSESPIELREEISEESRRKLRFPGVGILLNIWRASRNAMLRRADRVIAISEEIHQQYLRVGIDQRKIALIPNGVDTDLFCPVVDRDKKRLREEFDLPVGRPIFVFSGRLSRMKGVMTLIEIWAEVVSRYPDVHLVYVGSGKRSVDDCEEELREFVRANDLATCVTFVGEVDDVQHYLQAADVFVLPSDYEGFSLALVEALSCGLPVISTRAGGASEVICDGANGMLIAPRDASELSSAIDWMLSNRDRWHAMGALSRETVMQRYSIDVVAARYVELFGGLTDAAAGAV